MNAALERLRSATSGTVILESDGLYEHERGLEVGLQLHGMREVFETGVLPIAAIEEVVKRKPDLIADPQAVAAEVEVNGEGTWMEPQKALVARCITSLGGEPATLTVADVAVFSDAAFYELLAYVMRDKPLPGKA